ncbi:TPA: TIGR04255 family protein [Morganella morganii]|nr:TIGR04255 family protein [Morganella morganii]
MAAQTLVYMLVKIEFGRIPDSTFLRLADEISESIRKDYPIAPQIKKFKMLQLDMRSKERPEVSEVESPVMTFLSPDKNFGLRIGSDFLVVHTKKYQSFSDLSRRVAKILPLLIEKYEITHYSFLGIRYVNKIIPDDNQEFDSVVKRTDFLQPQLCKWLKGGSNMLSHYVDRKLEIALRINSGVMVDGMLVPADLMEVASDIVDIEERLPGPIAHIDIDATYNKDPDAGMDEIDTDEIIDKMSRLRSMANAAYENIIYK